MGTEDDHVANKKGVGSKESPESTENVGNNGKRRKQQKASETTENIGNNRKCRKTTENVGNVGIGTGGNMVHDNGRYTYPSSISNWCTWQE